MYVSESSQANTAGEQLLFVRLYNVVVGEPVDLAAFDSDELYALEVMEHATRCRNEELRNLAAHLQAARQADVEVITLKTSEQLDRTWQLPILNPAQSAAFKAAAGQQPAPLAEMELDLQLALARLSAEGILNLTTLQRLYRAEFNRRLDLEQIVASYVYGRQVLGEALACGTPELLAAITRFLEELEGRAHGDQLIF